MADKLAPFSVRRLEDFLGGVDPDRVTSSLLSAGYRGFYVRIPPELQLRGGATSGWASAAMPDVSMASMVELTTDQLDTIIIRGSVELAKIPGAALYPHRDASGVPTCRLIRQTHLLAELAPIDGARTDIGVEGSVRRQPIPGSTEYQYFLTVTYADLYVKECDLVASTCRELISGSAAGAPQVDKVPDPCELESSSPFVYAIMETAYDLREGQGVDFDATMVLSKLKAKPLGIKANPHPFKNDQGKFAAQLVNRSYGMKQARPGMEPRHLEFVQAERWLDQDYYSPGMKKLLYAASGWSGKVDAGCQGNVEGVAKLLTELGFRDGHDKTEVRYMLFFITGEKQPHPTDVKSKAARHRTKPGRVQTLLAGVSRLGVR